MVDSFYPESRLEPEAPQDRRSCYGIVETARGTAATIIAGYTADTYAAIRVLRADGAGGYTVAWESPETWLTLGSDCFVDVKNVDGTPALEAFVTFARRRATTGWMLKWNGTTVENMTPMESIGERQRSLFDNPSLVDLEHDRTLQVSTVGDVSPEDGEPAWAPDLVYHSGPAGYRLEKAIVHAWPFRGGAGARTQVHRFKLVRDSVGPYTVRIVNGARDSKKRVTAATIEINGVQVIGPTELNGSVEFAAASIPDLPVENVLKATLTGPADSTIIVIVEDSQHRQ